MKRSIKSILPLTLAVFVILFASSLAASAQTGRNCPRGGINQRQGNQQGRIRQGVRSGELTRAEAARLEAQEFRIRNLEARLREGGLTASERARLERDLNRESQNIYRQKHDGQDR